VLSERDLSEMPGVGVRIDAMPEGWRATIVRRDTNGCLHGQTWSVRPRIQLAVQDARRCAPDVPLASYDAMGAWWIAMCQRRYLTTLEYGLQLEWSIV